MDQNQPAHGASAAAGSHEPAALPHLPRASWTAPPGAPADNPPGGDPDFVTEEQANAYWQGVADGIRQVGGIVPPRLAARAAPGNLLVPTHEEPATTQDPDDILAFTPATLRARHDGWTPEKQVAFVEALADTGIIRAAAARVKMTPQSVSRLRRRKDARAFDLACRTAEQIGRRAIVSVAWERAIEGTIRRHYFHGELKSEERVFNDRLLMALLNRLPPDPVEDQEADRVERNWDDWMDALAEGRDPEAPPPAPESALGSAVESPAPPTEARVWEDDGDHFTDAPPPAGFDLHQEGTPGDALYQRILTGAEQDYWEAEGREAAYEQNDRLGTEWFLGRPTFFPWGCEPSAPSEAAEPEAERSGASESSGESRPGSADGSSPDEPDRRHGFAGTAPVAEPQDEASEADSACGESRPSAADGSLPSEPDRRHGFAGTAQNPDTPATPTTPEEGDPPPC
mgnify:CR=1 FL=1